ncbi:MAG: M48 family metalloprotease, partial [Terriglobales bacterium]
MGIFALLALAWLCRAGPSLAPQTATDPALLGRVVARERAFEQTLAAFQPRVETYIQALGPDPDRGAVPVADAYFLGTLDARHGLREPLFTATNAGKLAHAFSALGFVAMVEPDPGRFDLEHYQFAFQGRQFLGAVRCLVFNVAPRTGDAASGQPIAHPPGFVGRIWVEDQDDTIVRFDGAYAPNSNHTSVHFDSWRQLLSGLWLPVAIYSQESDRRTGWFSHIAFKAQTRFWGYQRPEGLPASAQQPSPAAPEPRSPLADQRAWELKAETDVLVRMEQAGLLSPPGPVDQILDTVARNLELTNHLNFDPPVRCRVLLTAPLESFTVGHTIVLSRGLIDVLPDEASLAMMLAHELAHIALDHAINSDYAFDDRMIFPDAQSFRRLRLARSPAEEAAADAKGLALLENSPYKSQLASAGLFLEALQRAALGLPNLITAHLG